MVRFNKETERRYMVCGIADRQLARQFSRSFGIGNGDGYVRKEREDYRIIGRCRDCAAAGALACGYSGFGT